MMNYNLTLLLATLVFSADAFVGKQTTSFLQRRVTLAESTLFSEASETEVADAPADVSTEEDVEAAAVAAMNDIVVPTAPVQEEPENAIFIGNLPSATTEADITELFGEYGTVKFCRIPLDKYNGLCRGFGFVHMTTVEEMNSAIEALNGHSIGDRQIRVSVSDPTYKDNKGSMGPKPSDKKLYIGNLSFEATEDDLTTLFSAYEPTSVFIPKDRDSGLSKGYAFVTLKGDNIDAALEEFNGTEFMSRTLKVDIPLPRGEKTARQAAAVSQDFRKTQTKLYVGNLSFYTTLDEVRELFEEYGTVMDCYMPMDRYTGRTRGFAFVTMDPEAAIKAAEETDGLELDGRPIRVNEAQPKGFSSAAADFGSEESQGGGDYGDEE
eukprot:CAMPEP_0118712044 /NCGR_PEP_ID=MMETSP0800-20121206/24518_1 /TAXON_ID=210618 ORGANISM="Striatella unipunctata, Strain CCMP2910" /NCGR_SAMPLE_ID=MMETSP0800 /ASSEMBLY_ACC=CAM_ASM_000638 /LENGTH=379 /DNA_ID=CAMNT_0006616893 /DNA_START=95 /DNA_END=1234 /DNA_ORIENTATION=+